MRHEGLSRPGITIKAGVETGIHYKKMPYQPTGPAVGGVCLPEFKSKWLSCDLHTFLQSVLSGRILRCPGDKTGLCSLIIHFMDPQELCSEHGEDFKMPPKGRLKMLQPHCPCFRSLFLLCRAVNPFQKGSDSSFLEI